MEIMTEEQFYARMDQLLEHNKWSVYRLSQESGVALSTIYNLRRRKSEPKMETFFRFVGGFHITVDQYRDLSYIPKAYTGQQMTLIELTDDLEDSDVGRIIAYAQAIKDSKKKD